MFPPLCIATGFATRCVHRAPVLMAAETTRPAVLAQLAAFGAAAGPAVDAVHNQALLQYDVLPIAIGAVGQEAKSSLLIPPLLAVAYALLGGLMPSALEKLLGEGRRPLAPMLTPFSRAAIAVGSTVAIIKASEVLAVSSLPAGMSLALLFAGCLTQWAFLDGAPASIALASVAAVGGPLAELPFTYLGCWHYTTPDYWPLAFIGLGEDSGAAWAGLAAITAPCGSSSHIQPHDPPTALHLC
jgi:hypothetical protein